MQGISSPYLTHPPTSQFRPVHFRTNTSHDQGVCTHPIGHRKAQPAKTDNHLPPSVTAATDLENQESDSEDGWYTATPYDSSSDPGRQDAPTGMVNHAAPAITFSVKRHDNVQEDGLPIDVDAMDSDLNQQGAPTDSTAPTKLSISSSDESEDDSSTAEIKPRGKGYFDDPNHDAPLSANAIHQHEFPVFARSGMTDECSTKSAPAREDDTPELLISLYPHGILHHMLLLPSATAAALRLIERRLAMLSRIDDPASLERLGDHLRLVEQNWHKNVHNPHHTFTLLRRLKAFEHKHDVYSLEAKLNADYLIQKGRITSKQLAAPPEVMESNTIRDPQFRKPATWPRVVGWCCKKREYILRGAIRHLARTELQRSRQRVTTAIKKSPLVRIPSTGNTGKGNILHIYLQEQPDTIISVLTYLVCFTVKCAPNASNQQTAKAVLTADQQSQTPESIQRLLQRLIQPDYCPGMEKLLTNEMHWQHSLRLVHELMSAQDDVSLPVLLETRRQLNNLELPDHQCIIPLAYANIAVLRNQGHHVSAQLIHLFLTAQLSAKGLDTFPRWYFLTPPSVRHVRNALAQTASSPEKAFYLATLSFIDALTPVATKNNYEQDLHWMQCYYTVAYHEQKLLVHLMEQAAPHPLLPFASFQQNIGALWQLGKARKKMGHRALNPDSYAYYLSYLNVIWQEEPAIEDTIAELYRKRYLKQLGYDHCTEFINLFYDVVKWGSPAIRSIAANAGQLIGKLHNSGSSGFLNALYQEGKGLISSLYAAENPIHAVIAETLGTVLEVAQQCPAFFRVMWGDFALLMPQLESLLGQEASITNLLERIGVCMRGQALASLFTGDTPRQPDFDPTQHPRFATMIKRFQLLRDIISALHAGLPVIHLFLCRNATELKSSLKKIAWHTVSTYLARQCVNKMKPPIIRLCNNLRYARDLMPGLSLGLNSGFLAAMTPDNTVSLTHHIGRHSSLVTGAISYFLQPMVTRFGHYKAKIDQVKADPLDAEARSALLSERKKILGILGISFTLATIAALFINAFKVVVFISSPVLTTAVIGLSTFLCCGCVIARRYNAFDEARTSLDEAIAQRMKRTFAKDSPGAIAARQRIQEISKATLENMADLRRPGLSGWHIWRNHQLRMALSPYWHRLQYQEEALVRIKARIREKRHSDLQPDARHILNFVQARTLVNRAMTDPDSLSANPERLADLNQQLTRLFFLPLDAALLPYQLQYLMEEINAFLELFCGTTSPGENLEAIINTLETHNIELHKGDHIFNTLHMRHIRSSFLNSGKTDCLPPAGQHALRQNMEEERLASLPDMLDAQAILMNAMARCDHQQLQKEQQAREARMVMVNQRALRECLKHYAASSIPNLSTSPLFKANLDIQLRELERASRPWLVEETRQPRQQQGCDQPWYGCTYQAMEAFKAFSRS